MFVPVSPRVLLPGPSSHVDEGLDRDLFDHSLSQALPLLQGDLSGAEAGLDLRDRYRLPDSSVRCIR